MQLVQCNACITMHSGHSGPVIRRLYPPMPTIKMAVIHIMASADHQPGCSMQACTTHFPLSCTPTGPSRSWHGGC